MSDAQFTPGPWLVTKGHFVDARIEGGGLQEICWCGDVESGHRDSNAHLIAAAPDLYAALELWFAVMDHPDIPGVPGSPLEQARAALAKARGES